VKKIIGMMCLFATSCYAQPPEKVEGKLVFLGVTNDSSRSVWISVTTAGSFRLEAQGSQVVDQWEKMQRGLHLSLSPFVSQGSGGTHFLVNAANNKNLDSQNQQGGIVFPPLPTLPPGVVTPPIVVYPEHPIVIPPGPGGMLPVVPPTTASESGAGFNQTLIRETDEEIVPITKARQFDKENAWNIWSDNRYFDINDGRNNLDSDGSAVDFTVGADRRITPNLVSGLMLTHMYYDTTAFDGGLENSARGFNVGPYFGYMISPRWATDGSLTYGQLQNNNKLAGLTSAFTTQTANASLHATGLFQFGPFQLRPQPLVSFSRYWNPAYQFHGNILGFPVLINRDSEAFNFGYGEFKLEGNYTTNTKTGNIVQPYVQAGVDYVFAQPNDGQALTGNLRLATVSSVNETVTAGIRALISGAFFIDGSAAYLSIGQGGLSVWEARVLASYSFG
jgi:hypothetical protein